MPELLPINAILFQNLLRDFQVIAPPRVPVWWMSDIVQPVTLVNSQVTLTATLAQRVELFATNGVQVGSFAAGTILASTGALDVGDYKFRIYSSMFDNSVFNRILIQHRNAADTANIWEHEIPSAVSVSHHDTMEWTITMAQDERVRMVVGDISGAASRYNGIIWRALIT